MITPTDMLRLLSKAAQLVCDVIDFHCASVVRRLDSHVQRPPHSADELSAVFAASFGDIEAPCSRPQSQSVSRP